MTAGLIMVPSANSFAQTLDRLVAALAAADVAIFAQVDHAANARAAGLDLRPTTLVVFGAAKAGTPLMQANQALGLDLPLRTLVYEDTEGKAWIAYNAPAWIAERQGLHPDRFPTVAAMTQLVEAVVGQASA